MSSEDTFYIRRNKIKPDKNAPKTKREITGDTENVYHRNILSSCIAYLGPQPLVRKLHKFSAV